MKKMFIALLIGTTFIPSAFAASFSDVSSATLYQLEISWLAENGVIQGYNDGRFGPDDCVKRAELLKMIYLLQDEKLSTQTKAFFSDTEVGAWYMPYVNTAKEKGTVQGYLDGTFKPGQCVNRAEALKIAMNAFKRPLSVEKFQREVCDVHDNDWFSAFVHTALRSRSVGGEHTTGCANGGLNFKPAGDMSRKEVATMLYRLKFLNDIGGEIFGDVYPVEGSIYSNPVPTTAVIKAIAETDARGAQLVWTDETYHPGSTVKSYQIEIQCGDCTGSEGVWTTLNNDEDTATDHRLTYGLGIDGGSEYRFRVRALDKYGQKGIWSRYMNF